MAATPPVTDNSRTVALRLNVNSVVIGANEPVIGTTAELSQAIQRLLAGLDGNEARRQLAAKSSSSEPAGAPAAS